MFDDIHSELLVLLGLTVTLLIVFIVFMYLVNRNLMKDDDLDQ